MKRVIIESPYAGDIERNTEYARRCLKDSLDRGEAPLASHLLYPQVLDENDPEQRQQGVDAGLAWMRWHYFGTHEEITGPLCQLVAVYVDYGISLGMAAAQQHAIDAGLQVEARTIGKNPENKDA